MPIFEYLCRHCDKTTETIRKSAAELMCPHCGRPMERIMSVFAGKTTPKSSCGGGGCAPSGGFS